MSDAVRVESTEWFENELRELPPDQQARVLRRVSLLERKGWTISTKDKDLVPLEDGIWEVRVVGKGPAYRVLCFEVPQEPGRIVVLTNCVKKGLMKKGNVKKGEIERAKVRREVWLRERGGNGD